MTIDDKIALQREGLSESFIATSAVETDSRSRIKANILSLVCSDLSLTEIGLSLVFGGLSLISPELSLAKAVLSLVEVVLSLV